MGQKLTSRHGPVAKSGALAWETVAGLSQIGQGAQYADSDCIHLRGDDAARLSIVVSGVVSLSNTDASGRRIELVKLTSGEMFGVHQALADIPYTHDAYAIGSTRILSFDRTSLADILDANREFRNGLLLYLSDRLVRAMRMIETERRHPLTVRLAKYLYANLDRASGKVSGSQVSHADSLGVSRNALGVCLHQLAGIGLVTIGRQYIHIPSPERLAMWVQRETASN